jgi:hypothetical protein
LRLCRSSPEARTSLNLTEAAAAAGVPDNNRQARLKVWMDAVVARAAELMPASWDKRLGGTDVFLTDNLNTVAWSLHKTSQDGRAHVAAGEGRRSAGRAAGLPGGGRPVRYAVRDPDTLAARAPSSTRLILAISTAVIFGSADFHLTRSGR